jgi:putative NIF3 family GTP cyclohydrolase 1 type 2
MRNGGRQKRVRSDYETQLTQNIMLKKKNDGSPYSEKSIETFVNNIQKLSQMFLGKNEVFTNIKFLEDPKKVMNAINSYKNTNGYAYSVQSKWVMIQSIIICMNVEGYGEEHLKPYWEQRDLLRDMKDHKIASGETYNTSTSNNQQDVLMNMSCDDIHKCIDTLNESQSLKDKTCAMILQIHTEFPFRNDLADVKMAMKNYYEEAVKTGDDKLHNWLIWSKDGYKFVLNKFKTQKRYGMIVGEVKHKKTADMLDKFIEDADVNAGQHLFKKDNGEPYTRNNISVLLTTTTKKHLGKPISTTLLAKMFNDTPEDYKEWTIKDVLRNKELAYLRGHQPTTRITYYKKAC